MRIGIDARFYGPIGKGLGRYTQKLIENLERIDNTNDYFIFLRSDNFDDYIPKNPRFQKVLADFRWYTFAEQIRFPKLLRKYNLDLVHFPHFNSPLLYWGKFVVTIHDLILVRFPTVRASTLSPVFYWFKFWAYKLVIKSAVQRSDRVIAVSQFTKNDLITHYKRLPQKKVKVTYEACEDYCMLSPNKDKEILKRYGIIKSYILYVGNAYPHKNPERLVFAFREVRKELPHLTLVFVGAQDYFYQRLKKLVEDNQIEGIIFAGFVHDHDLDIIFHNALSYIRPSLYEGFELPPLEAMANGIPVISSNHECALEILGDSALYCNPLEEKDMARAIKEMVTNENLRKELIQKGYQQVQKYSWKRMAKETLEIYNSISRG